MSVETADTIIIGAGLSGLYAARLLSSHRDHALVVLEARNRVGGRILSPEHHGFFSDLGPSWYWPDIHPNMARLIKSMGLEGFRQFEEGNGRYQGSTGAIRTVGGFGMEPPSWRLAGGMMAIVERLRHEIPEVVIRLNHPVCKIEREDTGALISVGKLERAPWARFRAGRVILALPPRLTAATILFAPDLSFELTQAMFGIGTWMAGQAKFYALYERPFWRETGLSGEAFSEHGPLCEIHDGSNNNGGGPYGLTGFVGVPAVERSREDLLMEAILLQLAAIYGRPAAQPTVLFYQDWARERYTATPYDQPPMVENPRYHPPAGRTAIWDGCVLFAGTETADRDGGYLEGALTAAERAVTSL